jgi:fructokinase
MRILCVGEALIDMICTDVGATLMESVHFSKKTGGAPMNVAAAIASLGGEVDVMAQVGADPFGQLLIREMSDFGVNTRYMLKDTSAFTTFAFVSLLANGERDFVFNRGADANLKLSQADGFSIQDYGLVHFGSATAFLDGHLRDTYYEILTSCIQAGCFISFDPNYRSLLFRDAIPEFIQHSWHFFKNCHFFKVSDEEALLLTGAVELEDAVRIFQENTEASFCITLGSSGTLLSHLRHQVVVPSIPIQAVDTTGAGDAFVGAMLYSLANNDLKDLEKISFESWSSMVALGNKAGARTCEYYGAMEAFKILGKKIILK